MGKYFYLFICVCTAISVVGAVKIPVAHRVAQRLEKLVTQAPSPSNAENDPRFVQKSKLGARDCPSGTRKVQTTTPEYQPGTDTSPPISPADVNNAVGGALSLTFSPVQAVSLTGIGLSDSTGGFSLLLTGATGSVDSGSTGSVPAPESGSTGGVILDILSTGGTLGTGGATSAESCPLDPDDLPADLYGHAAFSDTINTAQSDINEQENLQWVSDANGGYDYNKLINDADQLLTDAEPYLNAGTGGTGATATTATSGSTGAR